MGPRFVVVVALLSLLPATAQAQSDAELGEARRQFELGVTEYEAGHLDDALVRFARAHALSGAPELLYNLATVHERLRHDDEALAAYEAYLAAVPDSADREVIEARVRVLRADATDETEEEVSTPAAPSLELVLPQSALAPDRASGHDDAPWILTGTGAVIAVAGGVLVALAALDAQTVTTAMLWNDAEAARDRVPVLSGTGLAAIGVGVVTAVVGIVWGATRTNDVSVALGPGSIDVRGTF